MAKLAKSGAVNSSGNDSRPNRKADKKNPGKHGHGSRRTKLTEIQKALMGKGVVVRYSAVDPADRKRRAKAKESSGS